MNPSRISLFVMRVARVLFACATIMFSGCGTPAEVIEAQDKQIADEYKEASSMPKGMTPRMLERRQRRLEMDFGVAPELGESDSSRKVAP